MADCSGTPTFFPLVVSGDANGDCIMAESSSINIPLFSLSAIDDTGNTGTDVSAHQHVQLSGAPDNMHVELVGGTGTTSDPYVYEFKTLGTVEIEEVVGKSPEASEENLISQGNTSYSPFGAKAKASNTVNLSEWKDSGGVNAAYVDKDFNFFTSGSLSGAVVSATEGTFVTVTGIDHGGLGGLGDDDHTQYHNDTRGDARYYAKTQFVTEGGESGAAQPILLDEAGQLDAAMINDGDIDHGSITGLGDDDHTQYSLAAGTRAFSGPVSGVSGTGDGALATMDMFGRMFAHTAYRSGSFTAGQTIFLYLNTTDQDANFVIPAGMTLKILAAYGRCKSGSSAGTTTFTIKLRAWVDDAHSSYSTYSLAAGSTASTNSYFHFYDHGTMDSPLASIVGSSNPVGEVGLTHAGPGTSGSDKHTVSVYGVFVDD